MTEFLVRDARPEDAAPACALVRRSIVELCKADHADEPFTLEGWLANKSESNMAYWIASPAITVLIAEAGAAMLGVGGVNDSGEIILAYVAPEARRKGITKALVARLEDVARRKRADRMSVVTTETARGFFESLGYMPDEDPGDVFGNDECTLIKEFAPPV